MSFSMNANFTQGSTYPVSPNVYNVPSALCQYRKDPQTMTLTYPRIALGKALITEAVSADTRAYSEIGDGSFETVNDQSQFRQVITDNGDGTLTNTCYEFTGAVVYQSTQRFDHLDYPEYRVDSASDLDALVATADIVPLGFKYRPGVLSVLVRDFYPLYRTLFNYQLPTYQLPHTEVEIDGQWISPGDKDSFPPYDDVDYTICDGDGLYAWLDYQVSLDPGTHQVRFRVSMEGSVIREATPQYTFTI